MKKTMVIMLAASLVAAFTSCEPKKDSADVADDQNKENLENAGSNDVKKDADFAVEAADGGLFEVQAATLALTKASSADVKQFAQMLVDDHTKANNELKTLASQKNIMLPDMMSEDCQQKYYDLDDKDNKKNRKPAEFDKDYIDLMVKDHKKDIDEFEKEASNGNDPEIQAWASGKLSTLKHHLDEAQRIQDKLESM